MTTPTPGPGIHSGGGVFDTRHWTEEQRDTYRNLVEDQGASPLEAVQALLGLDLLYPQLSAGVPVQLNWDPVGLTYVPAESRASTQPKKFYGPTDPTTISGVVMNDYDGWVNTT